MMTNLFGTKNMLKSGVCKQQELESRRFQKACDRLKVPMWFNNYAKANNIYIPEGILHRKSWEYAFITIALSERGMLKRNKKGLGFAVGTEPLPAYFASRGCNILATDLGHGDADRWIETGQNASRDIGILNASKICSQRVFEKRIKYRDVDMNAIPDDFIGFDFCWSSCAIEHLGSLEKSKTFLKNMLRCLKPGGIAVHTTEYNLSSDDETITEGDSVIFRKKDVLEIAEWLKDNGHSIELDLTLGDKEGDLFVDQPPYYQLNPKYHLRLNICGYVCTSFGFIISKGL